MKMKNYWYAAGLAMALFCSPAMASSWGTSSYNGLGYIDEDEIDDDAFSSSLSIVWRWNDNLGIEGGYTRFGDFEGDFNTVQGPGSAEVSIDGFTLGLNFHSPMGSGWYVTGRVGVWTWDAELDVRVPGTVPFSVDNDGSDFYAGAAVGYMFTERFGAGLGATYFNAEVDDSSTSLWLLGLKTNFTW